MSKIYTYLALFRYIYLIAFYMLCVCLSWNTMLWDLITLTNYWTVMSLNAASLHFIFILSFILSFVYWLYK